MKSGVKKACREPKAAKVTGGCHLTTRLPRVCGSVLLHTFLPSV